MDKELFEKGDVAIEIVDGKLLVVLGQDGKIKNTTEIPLGYVLDKLEEVIPGNQKAIFEMLKAGLGV